MAATLGMGRSSMFMVLPAAFGVFGYEVTGRADPGIRAFTTGRNEPQFHSTLGLFLNLVPYRHQPVRELPRDRGDHQGDMAVGATGELVGNLTYNIDEFDEQTVTGWTEEFNRILAALLSEPDRPWREVVSVAA